MNARYNFKWSEPKLVSTPDKVDFELVKKIIPISFNDDKSIKEYQEEEIFIEKKSKWKDFIKSCDMGSVSDQVISHIKRGTPLVTAHTLPHGDYTPSSLNKGAEILRKMREAGVTLDMLTEASMSEAKDASTKLTEGDVK